MKSPNFCYASYASGGSEDTLEYLMNKHNTAIAIGLCASQSFMNYKSGIYNDESCPKELKNANHAVNGEKLDFFEYLKV